MFVTYSVAAYIVGALWGQSQVMTVMGSPLRQETIYRPDVTTTTTSSAFLSPTTRVASEISPAHHENKTLANITFLPTAQKLKKWAPWAITATSATLNGAQAYYNWKIQHMRKKADEALRQVRDHQCLQQDAQLRQAKEYISRLERQDSINSVRSEGQNAETTSSILPGLSDFYRRANKQNEDGHGSYNSRLPPRQSPQQSPRQSPRQSPQRSPRRSPRHSPESSLASSAELPPRRSSIVSPSTFMPQQNEDRFGRERFQPQYRFSK